MGLFHTKLVNQFSPLVVRYIDLMEHSISQSIEKNFQKEKWEIRKSPFSPFCWLNILSVFLKGWLLHFRGHLLEIGCPPRIHPGPELAGGGVCQIPASSDAQFGIRNDFQMCQLVGCFSSKHTYVDILSPQHLPVL
jgi:hypothetical protein